MSFVITEPSRVATGGIAAIFVLLMISLLYVSYVPKAPMRDVVGMAGTLPAPSPSTCTVNTFSVTTGNCNNNLRSVKDLFCAQDVYVRRCFDDNPDPTAVEPVLNYCMNGFCGKSVLDMTFDNPLDIFGDTSGAGNDYSCSSCPVKTTGRKGSGIVMDVNKWFNLPDLGTFMPPEFTILLWMKPDQALLTAFPRSVILSNKGPASAGFALTINELMPSNVGQGKLVFTLEKSTGSPIRTDTRTNVLFTEQWTHVAVPVELHKGTAKIFVNGNDVTDVAPSPLGGMSQFLSQSWRLGAFTDGSSEFKGEIDELRIVPRKMTSTEILQDMQSVFSCGNGFVEGAAVGGTEECDDGDTDNGDGCSGTCGIEAGYICTGQPSVCTIIGCNSPAQCAVGEACIAGTCVADCIDSDGSGEEALFIKGNTQVGVTTRTDYCSELFLYFDVSDKNRQLTDGNLLIEQTCANGIAETLVIGCACDSGKCVDLTNGVPPATGCIDTDGGVNTNERGTARDNDDTINTKDAVWHTDYCLWDGTAVFPAVTSPDSPTYNKLREFKCVAGKVESELTTCDCQNGVCV